jgi:hypothetical protein
MQPAIAGMVRSTITGPFILIREAKYAPPMMAMSWTAPKGMLNKIVVNGSNPKDCTINGPNVEIPPLGILNLTSAIPSPSL